ncbi:cytochrome P450 [Aspergillus ustus]|uniref:Cytochrome P450 n=1 Tax=Aspergillus ustus TaxID=40382 RepID=A0A0C1E603_ASPUT|nr:cytochrome P450 [Aspergillus ustus]
MAISGLLSTTLLAILAYFPVRVIYNLYFHPLSKVPGPRLWASSRLPFVWSLIKGTLIDDLHKLHEQYGPVIRIAPSEVTFAHPDAYKDIFHPGQNDRGQFLKDPLWWARQPGHPDSLLSAINPEKHAQMRRILTPGFTPQALRAQEPFVQKYVNLLITQLSDLIEKDGKSGEQSSSSSNSNSAEVDMTPWFNYTTFDIFGDLGYGESFDCLQHSQYHPWISLLFNSVKAAGFVISTRFYPIIEFALMKCLIPASMKKIQRDHYQQIVDKVDRRLSWELQRPDIMSHVIGKQGELKLDSGELYATFMILTTVGSETTATALTGTFNYLVNHSPESLRKLEAEIRGAFSSPEEITLDAVRNLPFLNAVINEGLRLCPPVPWIPPRLVPDGGRMVCGTWIAGGTPVSIQAYSINRSPTLFSKPTSFLPERWLESSTSDPSSPFFNDNRQAIQPFAVGPRACLGINLAWAEMRLILAKLVFAFDFSPIEGRSVRWEELRTYLLVERKAIDVRIALRDGRE